MKIKTRKLHPAEQYAHDVIHGRIVACKYVIQACKRYFDDKKNGKKRGLYFNKNDAQHAIDFIQRYCKHSKGEWADQLFILEPWQQFIIWNIFGWKLGSINGYRRFRTAYIECGRKNGKALAIDTLLPTPYGWVKMKDVKIGDILFDENGEQCKVTYTTDIMYNHKCYRVHFSDGSYIDADKEHLWWTIPRSKTLHKSGKKKPDRYIFTTKQILKTLHTGNRKRKEHNHSIPVAKPIKVDKQDFILDPYILGVWLGDGHTSASRITTTDNKILRELKKCGFKYKPCKGGKGITYYIEGLHPYLYELGVLNNKHIPEGYLRGSYEQRLSLLQGLMDTDGTCCKKGNSEFTTTNINLANGIYELICSLGIKTRIREENATLNGRIIGKKWRIQFVAHKNKKVFKLYRKFKRQPKYPTVGCRSKTRQIVKVEKIKSVPVRCIQVDSKSHLYLVGKSFIPTHNTTLMAGIGNYLFIADGEAGAEVYSAAVKREQAIISHSEATRMIKKSPELRKEVSIFKNNLSIEETNSKFEPLGRDADSCDGLNVHGALVDELHAHKTDEMWNVLQTAVGSRRQSLQLTITTAGFDRNTICWQQHEYLARILEEVGKENCYYDDSYFGIIYTIDENDNWQDEECWIKANPNLGISVIWESIKNNAKKAKEIPSELNEFLRKHLCKWVQQSVRAIDMTLWDENFSHNIDEEKYLTKKCFGGLDLSSVSDLTAWIMLFPNHLNPVKLDIIGRFWCPEAQISNRQNRYRNFYEAWARDGWLITTPGDAIDYERVKFKIMSDAKKFNLVDMGIDMLFQGYQLGMELSTELGTRFDATTGKHESRVVGVGMGYKTMGPAMKEFEKRLLDRCLNHGNNPILRFCADNLAVSIDPAGNKKPNKAESQGKIDGIVATLIALDRVNRHPVQEIGSKYERSDMVVV